VASMPHVSFVSEGALQPCQKVPALKDGADRRKLQTCETRLLTFHRTESLRHS